ncbi:MULTISPECIES: site-2 protease family protein [Okeania]|uniref:Site-2 protease family protein n=1 Tax=Okeania hirsuta TaxID=1458930 RepID=A0A3N6S0E0_9CYAN|nr:MULTISPECIES: site-2 protease family protein [Okeania]NES77877.1 site-2 protease family protein [Okeania sp. SIO1H4]NES90632.1 site-2 protease family protein [Okeania sp. SIO2B9]NET20093.1 site-2 protease family protein [Okeania sp. SIO1H5]NET76747.1 site-2 protease family protein [Okeania sp. SIO1F9]NET92102.1 site-2 protease family protein [Okeania sp. SIO1H2]
MLFLLILLGLMTYFMLQRSVSKITRTPIWILWLVMMTPALIWTTWMLIYGEKQLPPGLIIIPFIFCPYLYWLLVQWGQQQPNQSESDRSTKDNSNSQTKPKIVPTQTLNQTPPKLTIDKTEEASLRNCFPWTVYYLRNLEFRPQAVICRGQLRSNPEKAYQTVTENIEGKFGDRFLVVFQNSFQGKPFFALVPNPRGKNDETQIPQESQKPVLLALGLLLITLFTTTLVGAREIVGISEDAIQSNPNLLIQGLPYGVALILILGLHEFGHYITAHLYKIRTTLPYFIPVPFFLGTFGAFIRMQSPVPNRKSLFDVSIAGPIAGLVVTIPLLIWGLSHSNIVPLSEESGILSIDSLNPTFSFLLAVLSKLALGTELTYNKGIDLHPIAVAGYVGLVVTAYNLMPIGQLDGGHIVHAMFGQRTGMVIGQISRFLLLLLAFINQEFLFLAIFLFLMPLADEPALNDVSELDDKRDFLGLLMLGLLVMILLPAPKMVIQWLNF